MKPNHFLIGIIFIIKLISGNSSNAQAQTTSLEAIKNYKAIPVDKMNGALISFIDTKGKKLPAVSLGKLGIPQNAFFLIPNSLISGGEDAINYIKNQKHGSTDTNTVIYMLKCRETKDWHNQTLTLSGNCSFTFSNRYLNARIIPQFTGYDLKPIFIIAINNSNDTIIALSCTITLTGTVICSNSCSDARDFHCVFISSDGLSYIVNMPTTEENAIDYFPCNSINNCSSDTKLPNSKPGVSSHSLPNRVPQLKKSK